MLHSMFEFAFFLVPPSVWRKSQGSLVCPRALCPRCEYGRLPYSRFVLPDPSAKEVGKFLPNSLPRAHSCFRGFFAPPCSPLGPAGRFVVDKQVLVPVSEWVVPHPDSLLALGGADILCPESSWTSAPSSISRLCLPLPLFPREPRMISAILVSR